MELEQFRDSIIHNTPVPVSEVDGYRAMDIAHQILNKIKSASINS
jgi:thiamine biosynthesis protein ThiC